MKSHLLAGLLLLGVLLVGCDKVPPIINPPTAETETSDPKIADLTKRANSGDAQAQYELGNHLPGIPFMPPLDGEIAFEPGTPQNVIDKATKAQTELYAKAMEWYQKAAAQGHAGAQFKLGIMYSYGDSVAKDEAKAVEWWQKAAAQGNADAQYELGNYFTPPDTPWEQFVARLGKVKDENSVKAVEWYQKAAAQGHAKAQFKLSTMYFNGDGVPEDKAKALEWDQKAAAQGQVDAQYSLGQTFELGMTVPKDNAKAAEWYEKAATQGHEVAQVKLAAMYSQGEGVRKDKTKAAEWYQKAATHGNAQAQTFLAAMYAYGEGVPKDLAKAAQWWQRAATQGAEDAQWGLGTLYYNGQGVPQDNVLAYAWDNLAASRGIQQAAENRAAVERRMSAAEIAEAQRLSSSWKQGQTLVREGRSSSATALSADLPVKLSKKGTGTLFLVSATGQAITNHHVVAGCSEIRIEGRDGVAKVVTQDVVNDLALVQIPGESKSPAAMTSDAGKLRQGDDIVVYGFPLETVLSSGGNLTPGVVSALTGLGNNTNQIQITAPIQPGSSGSPVLNKKGEVVGVVSMKLSDSAMAKATGQVGQNVNFAINGQTLRTFLDAHQVSYRSGAGFFSREKSMADLADDARTWTLVAECWK